MTPEQIRLICLRMAAAFHTPNSMSANCLDILEYAKAFEKFILGPQPVPEPCDHKSKSRTCVLTGDHYRHKYTTPDQPECHGGWGCDTNNSHPKYGPECGAPADQPTGTT